MRYIEMNPFRAAMVDGPAHYRWTRYRANARGSSRRCSALIRSTWHWARPTTRPASLTGVLFRPHLDPETIRDYGWRDTLAFWQ